MSIPGLRSISKKLAFLVVVAVLPALAILLYTGVEQRRTSIEHAKQDVLLLANSMAQVQADISRSSRQMLSTLALLPGIREFDLSACRQVFAAILAENPDFQNITLTSFSGEVLASGLPSKASNLADRKHVREALAGKDFAVGEYIVSRVGKIAPAFAFAFPVLNPRGEAQAVLTASINLNRFARFHQVSNLPEKSFVAITDHRGIRLFYYPSSEDTNPVGKPIKSSSWEVARNATSAGIFIRAGSDGTRRIFAYSPLRLNPDEAPYLYVWAGVPESPTLQAANDVLSRNLIILLVTTLLALFIAWLLGRWALIDPIRSLVGVTQRFAGGEFDVRSADVKKQDEVGLLASAFNEMADALSGSQKALKENEARFRLIMDSLDAVVYVTDMDNHEILYINNSGQEVFGDVVGRICWQVLQKNQTGPCPFCTNKQLLKESGLPGEIHTWEFQNTLNGHWYLIHDRAIRWVDGRIVRLEIATDMTERKLAANRLAEETERLAVTLRSIGEGVITTDTAGKVVLINAVAEQMTGWSSSDAAGLFLGQVFHIVNSETGQPCDSPVDRVLASGEIVDQREQLTLIAREGQQYRITDSGAPIINKAGTIIGVVLVFRDITEQLRTEQELSKIKKLESIGVLAGGIAHDFNNILAAILGNIDLALRDENLSERTQRLLRQALNASGRARDLTQQLLTFAKGGQPIRETASLAEVVRDSADFVLRGDKVACRYHFPDDLWLVDIDKGQISQVVQNVILNASNAMPDGGVIDVTAENIADSRITDSSAVTSGHFVKLSIEDTGIGIPETILDKIFDPYFSTKQQGSGLGLAVAHSIVSKHGGALSVKSTPGYGSTFIIHLPAAPHASLPAVAVEEVGSRVAAARILVMDDEELVRTVTKEMLTELGHQVLLAEDGQQAVSLYQQWFDKGEPIDLVIMDLTIPGGMGGTIAVQKILAVDAGAKVIVSSGYSNDPVLASYQDYGFVAALVKPYKFNELSQEIDRLLG